MISHPQWAKTRKKSPISKTKINIQHLEGNCKICSAHKWTFFRVSAHCVHIHDPQQDEYWRFSKVTALHIMQSRWRHHDQNILQAHYLVLCRYLVRVTYLLILTSCQEIGLSRCSLFINVIFLRGLLCHGSFLICRKPSANSSSQFLRNCAMSH